MIYKNEDLLAETAGCVIAHGCNAKGVMNSGVAKVIRSEFPEAFEAYRLKYETHGLELGNVIWCATKGVVIANCITQGAYGYDKSVYVDYTAIMNSLERVAVWAKHYNMRIRIPMIGAGLGGGDWKVIERDIKSIEDAYKVTFEVCILDQDLYQKVAEND